MTGGLKRGNIDNDLWLAIKTRALARWDLFAHRPDDHRFESVETFCLFIGYPRSGHSVVGSMIDAHPDALIAHRLDALKYIEAGHGTAEVFYLLQQNSRRFAAAGRKLTGYQYAIPGQWQGKSRALRVIGDQEGNWTARRLKDNPALLETLSRLPLGLKFIHVTRNPFDNITTWALRSKTGLPFNIERYFERCRAVEQVRRHVGEASFLDVAHEAFIRDFEPELRRVMGYLGLGLEPDLLAACARVIRPAPHRSRRRAAWTPALVRTVEQEIKAFHFLQGYCFDE